MFDSLQLRIVARGSTDAFSASEFIPVTTHRETPIVLIQHILPSAAFIAIVCLSGCDIPSGTSSSIAGSPVIAPLKVNVSVVKRIESTAETVVIYGTLIPVRESRLSFARGGKVQEIRNVAGDRVATGDVMALLDQGELDKQRQQLLTSLEQAKQRLRSSDRETAPPIQQQIGQLEGQLRGVEAELQQRTIVAPFAGLVSEIRIRQGEIAAPSRPVVVIVADEPPQLAVDLVEAMALRVLSQKRIWAGLGNQAVELTVKTSSDIRGPTPARRVVFSIPAELPNDSWSYGDVVELRFRETVDTTGCWLPLRAIQKGIGERWYVIAVVPTDVSRGMDSFTAQRRPVEIRLLQNNRAFVESSLTTGEFVIADGTHRIVVGQQVIPVTTAGHSMGADQPGAAN